jgi:uncharacterized protein
LFRRTVWAIQVSGGRQSACHQERQMAGFEWDPVKEAENLRKHGTDFLTASRIWHRPVIERTDNRRDYGEARLLAFGKVNGRLMAVLFTWRGANRRIISARKANRREQRRYQAEIDEEDKTPND